MAIIQLRRLSWGYMAGFLRYVAVVVRRAAYGIRLEGVRNLIGRRTESDWAANGIRSDGERNLIGRRTESDWTADANGEKS